MYFAKGKLNEIIEMRSVWWYQSVIKYTLNSVDKYLKLSFDLFVLLAKLAKIKKKTNVQSE